MTPEKAEAIRHIKDEANEPKNALMRLRNALIDAGAYRQARSLDTIIGRLEDWQHRR